MKAIIKGIPKRMVITVAVLLVLIAITLSSANTLGRYTTTFGSEVGFSAKGKDTAYVYVDSHGTAVEADGQGRAYEWSRNEVSGKQSLSVVVSNSENGVNLPEGDLYVILRVFVPGSELENGAQLPKLMIGDAFGSPTKLAQGSAMYNTYGEGYVYRLFKDGQEATFKLERREAEATVIINMMLEDSSIDAQKIKIIVETVQANGG